MATTTLLHPALTLLHAGELKHKLKQIETRFETIETPCFNFVSFFVQMFHLFQLFQFYGEVWGKIMAGQCLIFYANSILCCSF